MSLTPRRPSRSRFPLSTILALKGKMINQIQEDTGVELTIEDYWKPFHRKSTGEAAEAAARAMVNQIANPQMPEVGSASWEPS